MYFSEPFHTLDLFHRYFVGKNSLLAPYEARTGLPGIFTFTLISSNFHWRTAIAMPTHWEYCMLWVGFPMHKMQIWICSVTWCSFGTSLTNTCVQNCFKILVFVILCISAGLDLDLPEGKHPTEHSRGYWYFWCFLWVVQSPAHIQLQQDSYLREIWGDWRLASFPEVEKTCSLNFSLH